MLKEKMMKRAFNRATAFARFNGIGPELRNSVLAVSMEAYLKRKHVDASEEEIRNYIIEHIRAISPGRWTERGKKPPIIINKTSAGRCHEDPGRCACLHYHMIRP